MLPSLAHSPITARPAVAGVEPVASTPPRDPPLQSALGVLVDRRPAALLVLVGWKTSKAIRPANLPELISDPDCARFLVGLVTAGERHHDICALRRANDSEVYLAFDAPAIQATTGVRTVLVATDVTAWMRSQARLQRLAFEDALTGLVNRALLHDRIKQAIATARRNAGTFAVLLIDLDRFKPINDIHGHATGDLVLRETARRLQAA